MSDKKTNSILRERFGEKIDVWKKQYGSVFGYVSDDGKVCVLRAADLNILDACRAVSGGSSIRFDIALLENCWLDGDKELLKDDKYRMGLFDWLGVIIKVEGRLEEL
jgi:hypothetical protein